MTQGVELPLQVARSFKENLEQIRTFLEERGALQAYESLLDDLFGSLAPSLARFPLMGADLLAKAAGSAEGFAAHGRVRDRLPPGTSVRQVITRGYVVIYLAGEAEVVLLSIRHHKQLSLDLCEVWEE